MRFATATPALLLGATFLLATPAVFSQSATDENGTPIGMEGSEESGDAGTPEIVGTDGLIRYESSEQMWEEIASNWDSLGEQASERWSDIDGEELMATEGERDSLVSLVSESYDMSEEQAEQEVVSWATSVDDGM